MEYAPSRLTAAPVNGLACGIDWARVRERSRVCAGAAEQIPLSLGGFPD
jgi:hypothetical protein